MNDMRNTSHTEKEGMLSVEMNLVAALTLVLLLVVVVDDTLSFLSRIVEYRLLLSHFSFSSKLPADPLLPE